MSKKSQKESAWAEEIAESGLPGTIADRLRFHGTLDIGFVVRYCGCAQATAKKHLDRLVRDGLATAEFKHDDWHYRRTETTHDIRSS